MHRCYNYKRRTTTETKKKTEQTTKQGDNHSPRGVPHANENEASILEASKWS